MKATLTMATALLHDELVISASRRVLHWPDHTRRCAFGRADMVRLDIVRGVPLPVQAPLDALWPELDPYWVALP